MKNREEYFESIYAKRDRILFKKKKKTSFIAGMICLTLCFAAFFTFVPKKLIQKNYKDKSETTINNSGHSQTTTVLSSDEIFTFAEAYPETLKKNDNNETKDNSTTNNKEKFTSEIIHSEIATEATTRKTAFGWDGSSPTIPLFGTPAISIDEATSVNSSEANDPIMELPDSVCSEEEESSTAATVLKSPDEAINKAKTLLTQEDQEKISDDKTMVTINRKSDGTTTYTVYIYTNRDSYEIDIDAMTLEIKDCKKKNTLSGYETYISPPHFPETTEALAEFNLQ